MAKKPGTPKAKTDAPAQFDMNSRERKGGGKGGFGGPGRGRDEKRPPSHVISLPPTSVDRGEGWVIQKLAKVDQASHAAVGAEYHLVFEGHEPLVFGFLSAARERAKEPPPETAKVAADPVEDTAAPEEPTAEAQAGASDPLA
ncbi:MAG: hypothetical protein ACRYG6_11435 [Janthinobacterium lividum]